MRHANDELRQRFVDMSVPRAGRRRSVFRPELRWNERSQAHDFGTPFREEFIVSGDGPGNASRSA